MASQVATAGREQPGARHLNGAARPRTVWNTGGCQSWYLTRSGRNTIWWPGFTFEYRLKLRRFDAANYQLAPRSEPAHAAAE